MGSRWSSRSSLGRFVALFAVTLTLSAPAAALAKDWKGAPRGKLPRTVVPLGYTLELAVDPRDKGFDGEATIKVKIAEPTMRIWMHGGDLAIREATLTPAGGGKPVVKLKPGNAGAGGVLALDAAKPLAAGEAELHVKWRGSFLSPLIGAYLMEYGGERYVVTQMEPLGARRAFPCFDEPAFKTPWDLTLVVPEGDVAVANTHAVAEEPRPGGKKSVRFATTAPLPSYLVAFAVGPFDVVEWQPVPPSPQRETPLPLRGIAVKGRGKDFTYALENTAAIVKALEGYFGMAYPFDKLDLFAAPDFGYGAMENAGLITYKDELILIDDKSPTELRLAYWGTHAHEVSHQWFGNLVTMPWWDDLWLNESFATWIANKVVMQLHPEFHPERYQTHETLQAMETDDLASTRRIHEPLDDYTEAASAFDSISYAKGGAVLSMFEAYVGEERFRDAIRAHIKRFAGGNATSADLMRSIAAATDDPEAVVNAFLSFTEQPGVPVVDVKVHCEGAVGQVSLSQKRSLPLGSTASADQKWGIPVCIRAATETWQERACMLLTQPSLASAITLDDCPDWVMPNADAAGYYRFALEPERRARLAVHFEKLTPNEQLAYVGSLDAAYSAGTLTTEEYLAALPLIARGASWEVISAPFENVRWIRDQLATPAPLRTKLERYLQSIYRPVLAKLGLDEKPDDDTDARLARRGVSEFLIGIANDPEFRKELSARAEKIVGDGSAAAWNPDAIAADQRRLALVAYVQEHGAAARKVLLARLHATDDRVLRGDLLEAVAAGRDAGTAQAVFALILDPKTRPDELHDVVDTYMFWPDNRATGRAWMRQNKERLLARVPAMWRGYTGWSYRAGQCSEADALDFQRTWEKRLADEEGGPRNVAQAIEATRLCGALREKQSLTEFGKSLEVKGE